MKEGLDHASAIFSREVFASLSDDWKTKLDSALATLIPDFNETGAPPTIDELADDLEFHRVNGGHDTLFAYAESILDPTSTTFDRGDPVRSFASALQQAYGISQEAVDASVGLASDEGDLHKVASLLIAYEIEDRHRRNPRQPSMGGTIQPAPALSVTETITEARDPNSTIAVAGLHHGERKMQRAGQEFGNYGKLPAGANTFKEAPNEYAKGALDAGLIDDAAGDAGLQKATHVYDQATDAFRKLDQDLAQRGYEVVGPPAAAANNGNLPYVDRVAEVLGPDVDIEHCIEVVQHLIRSAGDTTMRALQSNEMTDTARQAVREASGEVRDHPSGPERHATTEPEHDQPKHDSTHTERRPPIA